MVSTAHPFTNLDPYVRWFDEQNLLRFHFTGKKSKIRGVSPSSHQHIRRIGAVNFAAAISLGGYWAESVRFEFCRLYNHFVASKVVPGDSLLTGLGYANLAMEIVKENGGVNICFGANSHPSNFWTIVAEESGRWGCNIPPIWPRHHMRQQRSVALADYILSPSSFVSQSYLSRGFPENNVLEFPIPIDTEIFKPSLLNRPKNQPFTIINTGLLSLRKGSPYLFQALAQIKKLIPNTHILMNKSFADSFSPVFHNNRWDRISVNWTKGLLPHALSDRLRSADIYIMPSLEEGMVRAAAEALCCGVYTIVTPNTGLAEYIIDGVNGKVVPIRDPEAIVAAVIERHEQILNDEIEHLTHEPLLRLFGQKSFHEHMSFLVSKIL